jgi:hypothetical protein
MLFCYFILSRSVGDLDPDPPRIRMFLGHPDPDPLVRGEDRIRLRLRILLFSCLGRTEIMLDKIEFQQNFLFLILKIMYLWVSYEKKRIKKYFS